MAEPFQVVFGQPKKGLDGKWTREPLLFDNRAPMQQSGPVREEQLTELVLSQPCVCGAGRNEVKRQLEKSSCQYGCVVFLCVVSPFFLWAPFCGPDYYNKRYVCESCGRQRHYEASKPCLSEELRYG